mmetsp:Transcript_31415/g.85882  ORF Transcript_31415/g.85882 Transcript_31415/m.85882 type:complete len:228 (+) Transcript_31415:109-792(+)
MSGADRKQNRRISFSALPAEMVVTPAVSSGELSQELRERAELAFVSHTDVHETVLMDDLVGLLDGLGVGDSNDFMQRQKVVPPGQDTVSIDEFVSLAGALDEFTQEVGAAGSSGSKGGMSVRLEEMLTQFFTKIDVDGDGSITQDEAIQFWGKNFAKVNATAMFKEVDSDGDGSITFDEWISFWVNVLAHGYDCDDLEEEVEMLLEGNSWVDFNDGRSTGNDAGGPS